MKIKDLFLTQEEFMLVETPVLGILKTTPVPSNIEKYYESEQYISHHQDSNSFKDKLYKFAQSFNLNYKRNTVAGETFRNAHILDYGCGAGEFVKYIEDEFTTFGYEPNASARSSATRKTSKAQIIDDINSLDNNSLDVITLWHVLEHIEDQETILKIFHQKLKENGKLIIAVPNYASYDAKYYKEFWAAYDVPRHLYHFSKKGMEQIFNTHEWKLKKIKPLFLDAFYISILSEKYKKNPLFLLKGGFIGAISNFKASKTGEFSSLIYIIEKK